MYVPPAATLTNSTFYPDNCFFLCVLDCSKENILFLSTASNYWFTPSCTGIYKKRSDDREKLVTSFVTFERLSARIRAAPAERAVVLYETLS
jgi:hypothetical protein